MSFCYDITNSIERNILVDIIDIMGIKKQKDSIPKTYNYYNKKFATVPKVTGLSLDDAMKQLKSFKVEIEGEGDKVIYQSPNNGTTLYEGDQIRLMLGNWKFTNVSI